VGLERGPLSLESTIENLFKRKRSAYGLERREYDRGDDTNFGDKRRSFGRYCSLAASGQGV
jgi:hypothetical protein